MISSVSTRYKQVIQEAVDPNMKNKAKKKNIYIYQT